MGEQERLTRGRVLRAVRRLGQLGVSPTPTTVLTALRLESGRLWPSYNSVQMGLAAARDAGELEQSPRTRVYRLPRRELEHG